MEEVHDVEVDLRWVTASEYPGADAAIMNGLLAAGWQYAGSDGDDVKSFHLPDGVDFEEALAAAQKLIGSWLIKPAYLGESHGGAQQ